MLIPQFSINAMPLVSQFQLDSHLPLFNHGALSWCGQVCWVNLELKMLKVGISPPA